MLCSYATVIGSGFEKISRTQSGLHFANSLLAWIFYIISILQRNKAAGDYSDLNKNIRFILGIICAIIPFAFIPCYQFLTFKMRLHQNKKKYKAYVYHDVFFLFSTGLWCMWLFGSFFFGSAMSGNYKLSWDWIFGVLLVIYYMGGICMALLRQATFVIMDGQYSYYNLKKTFEGELKDIGSVEMVKGGIILHIKEEELYIRCTQMPYADLLKDKLADFK